MHYRDLDWESPLLIFSCLQDIDLVAHGLSVEFPTYCITFFFIQFVMLKFKAICSPNKRSFIGPGGFGRGLDLGGWANICARELASVASPGLHRQILASRISFSVKIIF